MAAILNNLRNTIIVGLVLAVIMLVAFAQVSPHHFNRSEEHTSELQSP